MRNPSRSDPVEPDRCVTQFEREAAIALCGRSAIQGLGVAKWTDFQNTRWADLPACVVKDFPLCDTDCNDESDLELIQYCRAGTPTPSWPRYSDPTTRQFYFDNWCNQVGAGLMGNAPCPTPVPLYVARPAPEPLYVAPPVPVDTLPGGQKAFAIGGLLLLLVAGGATAYYISQRKGQ